MKTFRLIGIAIMAILISVNFASCSSELQVLLFSTQTGLIASLMQKMAIVMKFIRVSLPMMLILIK